MGQADYSASFDEATHDLVVTEIVSQSLNVAGGLASAASATASALSAGPFGLWALAFAAMGLAGAGMSTHGIVQQSKFLGDVNDAIDVRSELQSTTEFSLELYDVNMSKHQESAKIVAQTAETGLENVELFTSAVSSGQPLSLTVGGGDSGQSVGGNQEDPTQTLSTNTGGFGSLTGTQEPKKSLFM